MKCYSINALHDELLNYKTLFINYSPFVIISFFMRSQIMKKNSGQMGITRRVKKLATLPASWGCMWSSEPVFCCTAHPRWGKFSHRSWEPCSQRHEILSHSWRRCLAPKYSWTAHGWEWGTPRQSTGACCCTPASHHSIFAW